MASRDLNLLEPGTRKRVGWLLSWCKKQGIDIIVTCTYRTPAEQTTLYAQGRTKPGSKVTNARAWRSWHNVRRAFDICFTDGKKAIYSGPLAKWNEVAAKAKEIGLTWGGNFRSFKDKPHFQYEYDHTGAKHSLSYYVAQEKKAQELVKKKR